MSANCLRWASRSFVACLALALVLGHAQAAPVYGIGGVQDGVKGLGAGQTHVGAVTSFTFSETFANVTITIPIDCVGCTGTVFLTDQIGPGTTLSNLAEMFTLESLVSQTVFSGLTLGAGTYFVGMVVTTGFGLWDTTSAPSVFTVAGTAVAGPTQFTADAFDAGLHPRSNFIADLAATHALMISIDGERAAPPPPPPVGVDEPGVLALALIGLLGLAPRRRAA